MKLAFKSTLEFRHLKITKLSLLVIPIKQLRLKKFPIHINTKSNFTWFYNYIFQLLTKLPFNSTLEFRNLKIPKLSHLVIPIKQLRFLKIFN